MGKLVREREKGNDLVVTKRRMKRKRDGGDVHPVPHKVKRCDCFLLAILQHLRHHVQCLRGNRTRLQRCKK